MEDIRKRFIEMLHKFKFCITECTICDRMMFYFMKDNILYWSFDCDCTKVLTPPNSYGDYTEAELTRLLSEESVGVRHFIQWGPEMAYYRQREKINRKSMELLEIDNLLAAFAHNCYTAEIIEDVVSGRIKEYQDEIMSKIKELL